MTFRPSHLPRPTGNPGSRTAGLGGLLTLCICLLVPPLAAQQTWPSFRNDGSGITRMAEAPIRWSPGENIAWQAEIPGYGQSAPVVWNGRIFVTSSDGPWQERGSVHAYELTTGKKLWSTPVTATTRHENYFRNSRAAPTPVVDAERVVSFFPTGDVTAMDHEGKTLWSVPLFEKFGRPQNERGTASSLAQTDDLVFALVDHPGPSYLVALRKSDGGVAWKVDRGERVESWSSPVVATRGGKALVVVSSADTVGAYAAATGERLWQVEGMAGNRIPSATVVDHSIFVGSAELAMAGGPSDKVAESNVRIDLDEKGGYDVRWGARRATSYYSTPLAFAGYVYYVTKSGILYAVDAESGDELFRQRLGGPCWASAIGVETENGDAYVYFVTKKGETIVLRPGREFDEVARNQLWDEEQVQQAAAAAQRQRQANRVPPDQAPPKKGPEQQFAGMPEAMLHQIFSYGDPIVYATALVEGCLLIRTGQHLYCVGSAGDVAPAP